MKKLSKEETNKLKHNLKKLKEARKSVAKAERKLTLAIKQVEKNLKK